MPTPISQLAMRASAMYEYALPDPVKRKDLEYYRDATNRGYLSYLVPPGHTPSLYFKTPGLRATKAGSKGGDAKSDNRIW